MTAPSDSGVADPGPTMKTWYTALEIAARRLPDMPTTRTSVANRIAREGWSSRRDAAGAPLARRRRGRGGGWEYHYTLLPEAAQAALVDRARRAAETAAPAAEAVRTTLSRSEIWAWFDRQTDRKKTRAREKLSALKAVRALQRGGSSRDLAVRTVARQVGRGPRTLYSWLDEVAGADEADWLPRLCPRHVGRTRTAACDPAAWEFFKGDYLRLERPTATSCYARLRRAAAAHGWSIPSLDALTARLEREIAPAVLVLARQGVDAVKAMYPAQRRDRSVFHALEAVNADGHRFDTFVAWPGETAPVRPVMLAIQDLHSGMILAHRIDRSESAALVRLAFGDVLETYGIPDHAYLDNGRGFASKWLTGGAPTRYRFKVREDEPSGLLTDMGVAVHWTTPYSGQSKPIERAFRDLCDTIAKHPALAGSWTGNTPLNKPENHGSRAVEQAVFLRVVEQEIAEHNRRTGRRAACCAGRSFEETFATSYARAPIRKAPAEARRMWLLAAEGVRPGRRDGAIHLMGNRYWGEFLHPHRGQPLTVRFDPDDLHAGLFVYDLAGAHIGFADCIHAAGFADVAAAKAHGRARRAFIRARKEALAAARKLRPEDVAALLPETDATPRAPEAALLRVDFGGVDALRPAAPVAAPLSADERRAAARKWEELAGGAEVIELPRAASPAGRPKFADDIEFARWALDHSEDLAEGDRAYLDELLDLPSVRLALDLPEQKSRTA